MDTIISIYKLSLNKIFKIKRNYLYSVIYFTIIQCGPKNILSYIKVIYIGEKISLWSCAFLEI